MANSFNAQIQVLGRVTIPKEIRERLNLKVGDSVRVLDVVKLVPQNQQKKEAPS